MDESVGRRCRHTSHAVAAIHLPQYLLKPNTTALPGDVNHKPYRPLSVHRLGHLLTLTGPVNGKMISPLSNTTDFIPLVLRGLTSVQLHLSAAAPEESVSLAVAPHDGPKFSQWNNVFITSCCAPLSPQNMWRAGRKQGGMKLPTPCFHFPEV
ncbi:hypothetical protein EYF80_004795 [Liparis tanakae]|uniref:Uncharacterized protein n=1 Tax=Liparis tanakae TaxID=230148 RepID=A0A4Z2J3G1_9TELE|nr:hypothetical protein EYF80_004795 [Liparis tanakae]